MQVNLESTYMSHMHQNNNYIVCVLKWASIMCLTLINNEINNLNSNTFRTI